MDTDAKTINSLGDDHIGAFPPLANAGSNCNDIVGAAFTIIILLPEKLVLICAQLLITLNLKTSNTQFPTLWIYLSQAICIRKRKRSYPACRTAIGQLPLYHSVNPFQSRSRSMHNESQNNRRLSSPNDCCAQWDFSQTRNLSVTPADAVSAARSRTQV